MKNKNTNPTNSASSKTSPKERTTANPTEPDTRQSVDSATTPGQLTKTPPPQRPSRQNMRINRFAILGMLILVTIGIYPIIKIFIIPLILAATFSTLFFPLYRTLLKLFHNNRALGSFSTCVTLLLCIIIPLYTVMHLVTLQLIHFYQSAEPVLKDVLEQGSNSELIRRLQSFKIVQLLDVSFINLPKLFSESIKTIVALSSKAINKTSIGFFGLISTIVVTFFTMFYFFIDGEALIKRIKYLSPMRDDYEELIFSRFLLISRATIMGTIVIGLTQGALGGITLLIFGIKSWLLWGMVMVFLSIIPMVGAWLVLIPAGLFQILSGHPWQGIGILIVSTVVISNIDNLIRPRLVGKEAKLHDLIIFFSSLGGIATFGATGFIIGPVIAALFIAVIDIYSAEFDEQLRDSGT